MPWPTEIMPGRSGPQLRNLSDDRLRLESELFARILQLQSLRARGNQADNPQAFAEASASAIRFWSGPDKFSDEQVQHASALLDKVIAGMQAAGVPDLRREILLRLWAMERSQASQAEILTLDLDALAADFGVTRDAVRGDLAELIRAGYVEGYMETLGQSAVDGACRITPKGLEYIWNEPQH
jgi:hypothetical protein